MAAFFSKWRSDEKGGAVEATPGQPELSNEEAVVDEAQNDLHREMKPRQLSARTLLPTGDRTMSTNDH
jgi:amino acid transporter